jgi:hypothetical protein
MTTKETINAIMWLKIDKDKILATRLEIVARIDAASVVLSVTDRDGWEYTMRIKICIWENNSRISGYYADFMPAITKHLDKKYEIRG